MLRKKVPEGDIVAEPQALRKPDEFSSSTTPIGEGGLEFGSTIVSDGPLNGYKTTPEIAKALENISDSKQNADTLASLYYKVFLGPKAFTQEAKTTLSPITHARNVISAASFTGMNGNFFQNPMRFAEDFKRAYNLVTARSKSAIESDMGRKYFKNSDDYKKYVDEYTELQGLGIINTSARLGEITQSLDEVSAGLQNLSEEGKIYTMLRGWGDKTGFNKLRGVARTAYQAEDDLYKIQNFYSEQRKFTNVYQKMYNSNPVKFVDDYADDPNAVRELFFSEVYKLDPSWFKIFIENVINDSLTSDQKSWVERTIKDLEQNEEA